MKKSVATLVLFLVLTIINITIFFFRDHFQYRPWASYSSLYGACGNSCLEKWQLFKNDYPAAELGEAHQITDSILGGYKRSTIQKIMLMGHYLYQRFGSRLGDPTTDLMRSTPMEQYHKLGNQDSLHLWCSDFAQVFSFFCWSQGIICRNIEIMNPGDHHVVNECYIPEQNIWVLVDLTSDIILVMNEHQETLDLPGFIAQFEHQSLTAWQSTGDSLSRHIINPTLSYLHRYYGREHPLFYYHRMDNVKAYSTGNKLKQYILPVSWYDILVDGRQNNLLFYLKDAMILLWFLSFFVFIAGRTKFSI